jgi:hypothetical protein
MQNALLALQARTPLWDRAPQIRAQIALLAGGALQVAQLRRAFMQNALLALQARSPLRARATQICAHNV